MFITDMNTIRKGDMIQEINHLTTKVKERELIEQIKNMSGIVYKKEYMYRFFEKYIDEIMDTEIFIAFTDIWIWISKKKTDIYIVEILKRNVHTPVIVSNDSITIKNFEHMEQSLLTFEMNKDVLMKILYLIIHHFNYFTPQPPTLKKSITLDHFTYKEYIEMEKKRCIYNIQTIIEEPQINYIWNVITSNLEITNYEDYYIEIH